MSMAGQFVWFEDGQQGYTGVNYFDPLVARRMW
jgi:hypothetical protein